MDALTRAGYLAHAQSPTHGRRLAEAGAVIAAHPHHAVSVSWGKDSVALLSLVAERHPGVAAVFARYETAAEVLPDIDAVRDAVLARPEMRAIRYHEIAVPGEWQAFERAGHAFTCPATREERAALNWWARTFRQSLASARARIGADGYFLGMRAAESRARRMNVGVRGAVYARADGERVALPLAHWQGPDVWARLVRAGLPWCRIYDLARDRERQRSDMTWAAGGRSRHLAHGEALLWQRAYPEAFGAWIERWPELRGLAHV